MLVIARLLIDLAIMERLIYGNWYIILPLWHVVISAEFIYRLQYCYVWG